MAWQVDELVELAWNRSEQFGSRLFCHSKKEGKYCNTNKVVILNTLLFNSPSFLILVYLI